MKTTAIVCATLVATLGFSNVAFARDWGPRDGQRQVQLDPRDNRGDARRSYNQPRYVYQQPRYGYRYGQGYHAQAPRFYRGGYLPHEYRSRGYYVNNWNAYPSLYAPPYGYRWMNVDGNFLLVALATGLIANALLN